ncbi:MAG: hypothetical protein KA116_03860 [Proteobacteria bacterium]|nr:hypothetical protein [Pseudomonadota bacterium]
MGTKFKYLAILLIASQGSIRSLIAADSMFMPSITAEAPPSPIGGKGVFALGTYSETIVPFSSNAFESKTTGSQAMRYQVPVALGVEATYGLTQSIELGIASGYQRFATQQFTGRDTLNNKQYDILQYSGFPVLGIVRMRWQRVNWAPEIEIGAGALIGKVQTRSTQLNIAKLQKDGPFWEGHASVGSGFEWGEDYTVHFHVGYGGVKLGQASYKTSSYNIEQKNLQHGLFFKGLARYQF